MQKGVEPLAKKYCDKVARRLRGWVRDSTITEITLDCTDSICSNPELCDCDLPPAELWRKIVGRFGQPHEYAMRFIDDQGKRIHTRYWFLARNLTILAIIAVLFSSVFSLYLHDVLWLSKYQITDPVERTAAIARLREVFEQYRKNEQCSMRFNVTSRVYGRERKAKYNVLHKDGITILRPISTDAPHIGICDTGTILYYPGLQAYEKFPTAEYNRTIGGQSLIIGLLQNSLSEIQTAVKDSDVLSIVSSDTEIRYEISGVYFNWGDARFTVVIDAYRERILHFAVERSNETRRDMSYLYSESVTDQIYEQISVEALTLVIPAGARQTTDLLGYFYHAEQGWKAKYLIGQPAPVFQGWDVRLNEKFDFADYRGKPVLLVCCASWVPQHRLYLAALAEIFPLYQRAGVEIVVIAPDVERELTRQFLAVNPLPFVYLSDFKGWDNPVFSQYALYAKYDYSPAFISIGSDGIVKDVFSRYLSPRDSSLQDIMNTMRSLLNNEQRELIVRQWQNILRAQSETQLLKNAENYFIHGNDFLGKAMLEEAMRRKPDSLLPRLRLCQLLAEYDSPHGESIAESCLNDTNASPYPYLVIGDYYRLKKDDTDRAFREYNKAIVLDNCWLASSKLGDLFYSRGNYARALVYYTDALTGNPTNSLLLYKMGLTEYQIDHYPEANDHLRRSLQHPNYWRGAYDEHLIYARRVYADVLQYQGHYAEAIAELEIALQYDPYYDGLLDDLCVLLLDHSDRKDEAVRLAQRLIEGNSCGRYYMLQGRALMLVGRPREAVKAFRTAAILDQNIPELSGHLAGALTVCGDTLAQ